MPPTLVNTWKGEWLKWSKSETPFPILDAEVRQLLYHGAKAAVLHTLLLEDVAW